MYRRFWFSAAFDPVADFGVCHSDGMSAAATVAGIAVPAAAAAVDPL